MLGAILAQPSSGSPLDSTILELSYVVRQCLVGFLALWIPAPDADHRGGGLGISPLSTADASRLRVLVQSSSDDKDDALGAPAAADNESHSKYITQMLADLLDKAMGQLQAARNKKTQDLRDLERLAQSLKDDVKFAITMDEDKRGTEAASSPIYSGPRAIKMGWVAPPPSSQLTAGQGL